MEVIYGEEFSHFDLELDDDESYSLNKTKQDQGVFMQMDLVRRKISHPSSLIKKIDFHLHLHSKK